MEVTKEDFPSFSKGTKQLIFWFLLVNGAAIEASSSERETPISAVLSAIQSFAPSPHIKTANFSFLNPSTKSALCSGAIRANTLPCKRMILKISLYILKYSLPVSKNFCLNIDNCSNVFPVIAIT